MGKRGQNEGSIYKRSDGRWTATLNLGYRNGKRHRKSFYGKTRREVQEKLADAISDLNRGILPTADRQTVAQFLEFWLEHSARPNLRPRTVEGYEQHVNSHIRPEIGHIRLSKLAPQHVQALINQKLKEGLSPRTVHLSQAILRTALNQALRWELVSRNVASMVQPPRSARHEIKPLTIDEAKHLLDTVEGDRLQALYSVALAVGMRKSEILGLIWPDLDLDAGSIQIQRSLQRIQGKLQFVELKTERSRRQIPLPVFATEALRRHRIAQMQERLLAGDRWTDHELVFCTTIGTPLDGRNITRHFARTLKKAGLPRKRFHDLRHAAASLLLAQGVQPRVLMELLGHSQIGITMDLYTHVLPELNREAVAKMDAIFGD